jgi:uncharacterized membrane protein
MKSWILILLALVLGFFVGMGVSLANGKDLLFALQRGVIFALLVGVIVAILSWGVDTADEKGYPSWLGFLLVFCFNIFGLIILALLPSHTRA